MPARRSSRHRAVMLSCGYSTYDGGEYMPVESAYPLYVGAAEQLIAGAKSMFAAIR
jgi:hypothetical protein